MNRTLYRIRLYIVTGLGLVLLAVPPPALMLLTVLWLATGPGSRRAAAGRRSGAIQRVWLSITN